MSTNYPGSLDSYTTKVDNVTDVLAAHINDPQDAIVAIETTLGTSGNLGLCEGRLTLASGSPVTIADQTAKTTIYFALYKGNRISLYDGSSGWDTLEFAETSVSVPSTTTTPFDIFGYNNSGTLALETLDWTNDTTRATALTTQDGIYVKTGATTRRYLGTGRTTSVSGQTEDSETRRFLWNYYNRVPSRLHVYDATSHTYNTGTWRSWNNDATIRVFLVVGVVEEHAVIHVLSNHTADGLCGVSASIDTTSSAGNAQVQTGATAVVHQIGATELTKLGSAVGYHYIQATEYGSAAPPTFTSVRVHVQFTR